MISSKSIIIRITDISFVTNESMYWPIRSGSRDTDPGFGEQH